MATSRHVAPYVELAPPSPHPPAKSQPFVGPSIVVPAYRTGPVLLEFVPDLLAELDGVVEHFEVIVVDDGSDDGYPQQLGELLPRAVESRHLRVVSCGRNMGKGHAVRYGLGLSGGTLCGFVDGDGDIAARVIVDLLSHLSGGLDGVIAVKNPATDDRGSLRRLLSAGFGLYQRALLPIPHRDTQVGAKVFTAAAVDSVLDDLSVDRFAFDVELLSQLHAAGHTRIAEVAIALSPSSSSTITPRAVATMAADVFKISRRRHSGSRPASRPSPRS